MPSARPVPKEADIIALEGHRFPGGHYHLAHWENVLLTGCTGGELLSNALAHPIFLFHLPILGAGTSIAEMFALGQAESDLSIMIEDYQWEFFQPLREDTTYQIAGGITLAERCRNSNDQIYDRIRFRFDVQCEDGEAIASSTVTWHYTRNTL